MPNERNVWVFVEQVEGQLAEVSLELLAKGRELAQRLGGEVWAVLGGHHIEPLAQTVIQCGADRVLAADHPELALYRTLPYARMLIQLVQARRPYILLIGATPVGRDLAPRVASAVRAWRLRMRASLRRKRKKPGLARRCCRLPKPWWGSRHWRRPWPRSRG